MEWMKMFVILWAVNVSARSLHSKRNVTPQNGALVRQWNLRLNPLCRALGLCHVPPQEDDVDSLRNRINPLKSILGRKELKLDATKDQWTGEPRKNPEDNSFLAPVRPRDELTKHQPIDKLAWPRDHQSRSQTATFEDKQGFKNGGRQIMSGVGEYHQHTNRLRRELGEEEEDRGNETVSEGTDSLNDTGLSYRFHGVFSLVDESFSLDQHPIGGSESDLKQDSRNTEAANKEIPSTDAIRATKDSNHSEVISWDVASTVTPLISETVEDNEDTPAASLENKLGPIEVHKPEEAELLGHKSSENPNTNGTNVVDYEIDINVDYGPEPEPLVPVSDPKMNDTTFTELDNEPEPEDEPTAETESNDDGCYKECYAEPSPNWDEAKEVWRTAWEIHVYGCGIAFVVLALYALASIVRLSQYRNLLSQGYFISLNVMLFILCSSRAVVLLVDGYNSGETLHPIVAYLLYSLGFPSLTSAFSILFLALLRTLKMQMMSPRIQSARTLVVIISLHFSISIFTDMILGYYFDSRITSMVCQVTSLLWGFFLMASYLYTFRCLFSSAQRQHTDLSVNDSYNSTPSTRKKPRVVMNLALKVTLITSLLGCLNMAVHVYGMVDVMNVFKQKIPDPWPWWGMHFTLRLTELAMAVLMMLVASQPFRYPHIVRDKDPTRNNQWWDVLYFIPCFRICQFENKEDSHQELQMTAHQESLLRSQTSYCHAQINHNITLTPHLDIEPRLTDNKLFAAVEDTDATRSRPTSMLVQEDGLIRFRLEHDPVGDPITSSIDDELDAADPVNTNDNCRNVDEDVLLNTYQRCHSRVLAKGNDPSYSATHSLPNTGPNTPATPRSCISVDAEEGVFTFRPPSSIHLRASIEGALDYSDLSLKSPVFSDCGGISLPEEFEDTDEYQDWNDEDKCPSSQVPSIPQSCKSHRGVMESGDSLNAAYSPLSEDGEQYTVAEVREFLMKSSLYGSEYLSHIALAEGEHCNHGTHV